MPIQVYVNRENLDNEKDTLESLDLYLITKVF